MRPFSIVNDRGFQSLMKMERPGYYIPSARTVSRDVKQVFVKVHKRIAKMLQVRQRHRLHVLHSAVNATLTSRSTMEP